VIDPAALLQDLQRELAKLEDDLRERCAEHPQFDQRLRAEYDAAKKAERTAASFESWREERLTQIGAAWLLSLVFARFLEDNGFVPARLAGVGRRGEEAAEHHQEFIRRHPRDTDREYLQAVFAELRALPALHELYDERWNPLALVTPSGDAAQALLRFFQRQDAASGALVHDFTDPEAKTRFLGDLYQDLSAEARKRYALLQTPEFVEEFLLERTLDPAIEAFGLREVRIIDPACGSGHFLLGAFHRLLQRYALEEPATSVGERVLLALQAVQGVDLNPFAIAIARFRLLVAALKASGFQHLKQAPNYQFQLAVGDSLLHGRQHAGASGALWDEADELRHHYSYERAEELKRILGQSYHVVVANPPYITVKDRALRERYRGLYSSCSGKYALVVPFVERLFELCLPADPERGVPAGYLATIVANSFLKREFGKKLIGEYLSRWDLTHVIDTSGAYLPGHGTPTVILIARRQRFRDLAPVRTVMGIRGEPSTPDDPAQGKVWRSIVELLDQPGEQNEFVSVADSPRELFNKHPWSLGGGGASELKEMLEEECSQTLGQIADSIGISSVTGEDEVFAAEDPRAWIRARVEASIPLVIGEQVRDWEVSRPLQALWLYDQDLRLLPLESMPNAARFLWPYRTNISKRKRFGVPMLEKGLKWYEWQELYADKLRTPLSITFAFVATHNHFVLDRGGKVFNRSAPILKLPSTATEEEHLGLLGVLNSSTACFWMKQSFQPKATATGDISLEKGRPEANRYEFAGTALAEFPCVPRATSIIRLSSEADARARAICQVAPSMVIPGWLRGPREVGLAAAMERSEAQATKLKRELCYLQEELDWACYEAYGLTSGIGTRSELEVAEIDAAWRPYLWKDGALPSDLPSFLRDPYLKRRQEIGRNPNLGLIETPVYKRPWLGRQGVYGHLSATYADQVQSACREWMLSRLESPEYWMSAELRSCAQLADVARRDPDFCAVAEYYRGGSAFDWTALVTELVEAEHVPFLPVQRYTPSGLRKRAQWEATWELQRREDRGETVGEIPVPPKFASADFAQASFWRQRGKLDVPRERFVSYPSLERDGDTTLRLGWGGWDHLQQAQALAAAYQLAKDEGWSAARLQPILAGLLELLPWLEQWHDEPEPGYDGGWGSEYKRFLEREAQSLGLSREALRAWTPPAKAKRGGRKKSARRSTTEETTSEEESR
jgi:SAM-dependent methyltransferase